MAVARLSMFGALARAAGHFAGAIVRRAQGDADHPHWAVRAEICERCPLRVVAGNVSYCGQPIFRRPIRDEAEEGCGCPTREKAKSPEEHCPLSVRHLAASAESGSCDCKWCSAGAGC